MSLEETIKDLQKSTLATVSTLATEFRDLVEDASIAQDDPLTASRQKLQIDVHTMKIDQSARNLLRIIRSIKELKVTDNSYTEELNIFEEECKEAANAVQECVRESYNQLNNLALHGFSVCQSASKLLRS